jgi:hypothetical protein
MIPILGKPVMAYLIEHLEKYGVKEIMVNVSYLHEKIEEYFGEGHQYGVQIGYSFEGYTNDSGEVVPQALGSAGGMKKIQEFGGFFDDTTIVLCGDAVINLDIKSALFEHRRKGALASVICCEVPWDKVSSYGVVVSEKDGRIKQFQEKPSQEEALSNFVPAVPAAGREGLAVLRAEAQLQLDRHRQRPGLLGSVAKRDDGRGGPHGRARHPAGGRHLVRPQHQHRLGGHYYRGAGVHWLGLQDRSRHHHHRTNLDRPWQPHLRRRQGGAQRAV